MIKKNVELTMKKMEMLKKKLKNVNDDVEIFFLFFHNETKRVKYHSHTDKYKYNNVCYIRQ